MNQAPIVRRDWAHRAAEYCKAVAPYATPLLETARDLFEAVSVTRDRLETKDIDIVRS